MLRPRRLRAGLAHGGRRRRGRVPASFPIWVVDAGDDREKYVELQRDQTVADVAEAVGGRTHERRTREARDLHRHDDRPGPHERRPDRRDREPTARVVAGRAGTDQRAPAVHAGPVLGVRRAGQRSDPARPDPRDPDPRLARRARRRLRERRPVEAAPLLPAERGGHGRRRRARVPGVAHERRRPRRQHARQDRRLRARRRRVPRPDVHEPDVEPCRRLDPVRADARPRRDGLRRRRGDAPGRGPLRRHHDDRRRGRGDGSLRGMAPDRVDRPAGVLHERDGAVVGGRGRRAARARRRRRGRHGHRPRERGVRVHDVPRWRPSPACPRGSAGSASPAT